MRGIKKAYREIIFPRVIDLLKSKEVELIRKRLLAQIEGKCLELGAGEGHSFKYYPSHIQEVYVVEPNEGMHEACKKSAADNNLQLCIGPFQGNVLGFEDGTFDTVVIQFVLCSVEKPDQMLKEIKRVLKPGGKLVFIEHGRARGEIEQNLQQWFNGVYNVLGEGCNINRSPIHMIRKIGFREISVKRYRVMSMPILANTIYEGYITK